MTGPGNDKEIIFGKGEDGRPVSFSTGMLSEVHFSVSGATGQRKTLFVLSMLLQFFKAGHGIVFVDLGGDIPAYWLLRRAAEARHKRLWFFSVDSSLDSLYFDPILSLRNPIVAGGAVGSGLNLTHAPGYGRTFWGRVNAAEINTAFDHLAARGITVPSFAEFCAELERIAKANGKAREISEAKLAAEQLNRLHYFGVARDSSKQLVLREAIRNGDIVVFHCPSALYGDVSRAVATLSSWCAMVEQENVLKENPDAPPPITHLVVDEYAQVASGRSSLESQLTLVRKWGLQMWLVFQNREQLRTPDGDLYPTIRSNCQNFVFSAETEEERRDLMNASLDEWKLEKPSRSIHRTSVSESERWYLAPRLERNTVIETCAKAMMLFGIFKLGDKHRDPIPFQIIPPTKSVAEHNLLKALQYPARSDASPAARGKPSRPDPVHAAKLSDLIRARKQAECYGSSSDGSGG